MLISCEEKKVDERQLLLEELNKDTKEIESNIQFLKSSVERKNEDKPLWYREEVKLKILNFGNSIDSLILTADTLQSFSGIETNYKLEKVQSLGNDNSFLFRNLDEVPKIEDVELLRWYKKRAIRQAQEFFINQFLHADLRELKYIYPDQFEQYKYLKKKFKAYEE
ncbi:hypothetical protein JCM19314_59 [Nonlabens ulvanivorans]|uniref:Uncharacterized protein n=1 Tax=Nonlabens ulvanivorans TaxID=906888 RepID=A0A090QF08_NONUL|nr:hypothetical protein JCM19314_59 [Nonlabens ulvanivorans]